MRAEDAVVGVDDVNTAVDDDGDEGIGVTMMAEDEGCADDKGMEVDIFFAGVVIFILEDV